MSSESGNILGTDRIGVTYKDRCIEELEPDNVLRYAVRSMAGSNTSIESSRSLTSACLKAPIL